MERSMNEMASDACKNIGFVAWRAFALTMAILDSATLTALVQISIIAGGIYLIAAR